MSLLYEHRIRETFGEVLSRRISAVQMMGFIVNIRCFVVGFEEAC